MDKFATLQTDIQNDAIPTCVCEKTMADKTEKFCLNCGVQLGGGVLQASGLLGGIGQLGLDAWKTAALVTAKKLAAEAGAAQGAIAGKARGMDIVIYHLKGLHIDKLVPDICKKVSSTGDYTRVINFAEIIIQKRGELCGVTNSTLGDATCNQINIGLGTRLRDGSAGLPDNLAVRTVLNGIVEGAKKTDKAVELAESAKVTAEITEQQTALIEAGFNSSITSINASIFAIVVIVLIMVIIYLILRYRRKKKMKKKLQYIKLLDE
ncbi:hypothetical protein PFMC_05998 [Plasmodium falciparum CAMP/Malaysia]|nr:hypothetical protein PFMC_05998 [Plasmodium falciparum CAMP/Malaysia]